MKIAGDVKEITVTQKQLSDAFGITPGRVNQLIKDGVVVRDENNAGGAVYLYESTKRYWAGKLLGNAAPEDELNINLERAKREAAERKMAELKLARMEGNVYDARIVEMVVTEMLSNLRTQLLGLPTKLAPVLDGKKRDDIYTMLTEEIESKLNELSEYTPQLFLEEEIIDDENRD